MDETAGDAADEEVVGDEELDRVVEVLLLGLEHRVELLSLGNGAGEAIEDEPALSSSALAHPSEERWGGGTHPSEHSLFSSSCCWIMPTMISSLTSPPWSMIFFACLPRSVPCLTCSRSMSPVARWQTLYASLMLGAWVPLPVRWERVSAGSEGSPGRLESQHRAASSSTRSSLDLSVAQSRIL